MSEPRFCKDCAHYSPSMMNDCQSPENHEQSLVTGDMIVPRYSAQMSRSMEILGCTKEGKWWKAKAPS